jgi:Skp family chaperone for outer membrane proteins
MNRYAVYLAAAILVLSAFGAAQPPAPVKIAIVNSYDFADDKAGVTKFVAAMRNVRIELGPEEKALDSMNTRLQALAKEIETLRNTPNSDPKVLRAKIEEGEKLQRDIKYKIEDAKDKYARQEALILGPVMQAIGKGLQEYAKQKGYTLIFDVAKDQNGFLIAIGDQTVDVTKDFITYYNAKP